MITEMYPYEVLYRNGVIFEKAKQQNRLKTKLEWTIIEAGREFARRRGWSTQQINAVEMLGERDKESVLAKTKVVLVFAYYDEPYEEIPAQPMYVVRQSNHPALPTGSHVSVEDIVKAEQKVPKTPSYEKWVNLGRKVVRS